MKSGNYVLKAVILFSFTFLKRLRALVKFTEPLVNKFWNN